jgi:hypothetical protein
MQLRDKYEDEEVATAGTRHWLRHRRCARLCHPRHGTIGFEGRFDYAAIGTVSNVASRLCDEAKPGQILISPGVLMAVEVAVEVEPVGEFVLKGIRRPLAAYNVLAQAGKLPSLLGTPPPGRTMYCVSG